MKGFRELIDLHLVLQTEREAREEQDALKARLASLDERLAGARKSLEEAQAAADEVQSKKKALELDVERREEARKKYRAQTMEAKTNEVYRTLLHEIEVEGEKISEVETSILELMEAADEAASVVSGAQAELSEAEKVNEQEASKLAVDIESLEARLTEARKKVAVAREPVPRHLLAMHDRIAGARGGKGLALVRDTACTECHVAIRPQAWVEILTKEEVFTCPGCGRILYRDESLAPPKDDASSTSEA